jgi:hypothetical protein
MKRFMFSKVLAILVMCFLAVIWNSVFVYGDVIWEPRDSFYEKERENCVYVNRAYYANGEKGYVTAYKNPESNWAVADFENGNDVYIQFIYKDKSGREWGKVLIDRFGKNFLQLTGTGIADFFCYFFGLSASRQ